MYAICRRYLTCQVKFKQGIIHGLHTIALVDLNLGSQLICLVFTDQIPYRSIGHHHFKGCHTTGFRLFVDQLLGDDTFQYIGQLYTDLLLLIGREHIHNTVNGGRCAVGVQCGEYQMTGFCRRDGCGNGLQVSHLTYQDHIRVLTESCPKGAGITDGIAAQLSLVDHGFVVSVEILNGIFQCDNMLFVILIDQVDQGCQCGGLTAAGSTGYQHQTTL